jgi:hypothetical protein
MNKPNTIQAGMERLHRELPDVVKWVHFAMIREGLCRNGYPMTWRTQFLELAVDHLTKLLKLARETLDMSKADDNAKTEVHK